MVRRTATAKEEEPEQTSFEIPSEKEHLFQVTDVYTEKEHPDGFDITDPDIVFAKCEVVGGEEEGRSTLIRLSLDDSWKGFFATRLFLKAICEPYKGDNFAIDTEFWVGRQFYATIVHNPSKDGSKKYANIGEYNFEKKVEQHDGSSSSSDVAWDE